MESSHPKPGMSLIDKLKLEATYQKAYGMDYAASLMEQAAKELQHKQGVKQPQK